MLDTDDESFDLFLSYAAVDDELPAPCNQWVTQFVGALRQILASKLGREPRIYFDRLTAKPNQKLDHILESCRRSRIFVAITSPAYALREWPRYELDAFVNMAADPRRLFLVEFQPISKPYPGALENRTFIQFYRRGELVQARTPAPLEPGRPEFFDRIWDLADAIEEQLARMRAGVAATPVSGRARLGPVLLAMPTDDLEDEQAAVRRYLEQVGAAVLPEGDFPLGGEAFKEAFAAGLRQAKLVVQLLGPKSGHHPPDLKEGYPLHQADAALGAAVPIMQWRNLSLDLAKVQDLAHRELLRRDAVTASTLEQFKTDIRRQLERPPPASPPRKGAKTHIVVFVNAEKADEAAAQQMREALADEYSVFLPHFHAEGSNQEDYREKLRECHAMLLVYGEARPVWVERQMLHAIKELRGVPHGAICFGPPPEKPRVNFSVPGFPEVDCRTAGGDAWRLETIRELMARLST